MFSSSLSSGLLSLLAYFVDPSNAAVATFSASNSGVVGTVTVSDGSVSVNLDLSSLDLDLIGGEECFSNGFSYHIHEKWLHNDNNDKLGGLQSVDCGSSFTGGHYDPWLACGPATGNIYCNNKGPNGCVTGSSSLGNEDDNNPNDIYSCSTFDISNPYSCEVGDWSGKYGAILIDDQLLTGTSMNSHFLEVDGSDLNGLSVVFHCSNDGSRAFCAPFTNTENDLPADTRPSQDDFSQIAIFDTLGSGNNNFILLQADGSYNIRIERSSLINNLDLIPNDCGDSLLYRVYNEWTDTLNSLSAIGSQQCSGKLTTSFYDPTVSCAFDSDAIEFCNINTDGDLCGDDTYEYLCDYNNNNRFSCAPGDLSGKYGEIPIDDTNNDVFEISGTDELIIDLGLISDKSVVLQCSNTYEIIACARFRDYEPNIATCLDRCNNDGSECSCDEVFNAGGCQVCNENDGKGCSQCMNGFFSTGQDTLCGECSNNIPNCLHCGIEGCQQCAQNYFRVYDNNCQMYYCA